MIDRVPIPLPLMGLSEGISADQQEPGTTARALNVRGVDKIEPARIRLSQRSGLSPHGTGAVVSGNSPVVAMFQSVKDTPPEVWKEKTIGITEAAWNTDVVAMATAWTTAVDAQPVAAVVGPDGNCYTLMGNGSVSIHTERGKLVGTVSAQAPTGFNLVHAIGVDEDGAVYTMAGFERRIDGGAGRLYRFRKRDDFWEREAEYVFEWVPRTFIYDRGEVLVTASQPADWDVDPANDGPAPVSRLYRIGGVKGTPFVVWSKAAADPAVAISANERGDIFVASPRNASRAAAGTAPAVPQVDWVPREATAGTEGVDASTSLYMHLSALRAQNVQGLADGDTPQYWRGATADPSDFPDVLDPVRDVILADYRRPVFRSNGMVGAPGFTFNGKQVCASGVSTGWHEKETLDDTAQHSRALFPNMRDAAGAGARFTVTVLFRINTVADADTRYVFEQGDYALYYFDDGTGNLDFRFDFPGGTQLLNWGGAKGLTGGAYVFTFVHDGHAGGSADVYLYSGGALLSFVALAVNINQAIERTYIGGYHEMGVARVWALQGLVWFAADDYIWHGGATYICILGHQKDQADSEPGVGSASATYWTLVAKLGLDGAVAECVTFLGESSAASAPHDKINLAALYNRVEGFAAWAYGQQGMFTGTGHAYELVPPAGTGSVVTWAAEGGLVAPQGLTTKYSRTDGRVMWVLANTACGNGVAASKDDYVYTATIEPNSLGTVPRARRVKDLGETVRTSGTDVWSVEDGTGDAWLGETVKIRVDHCGDLYLPWVDAETATTRTLRRYQAEGNGAGGPTLLWKYDLGSDAYPIMALPAGLPVDESAQGLACGPEFVYVPTVDPSPTSAPTYSVRRVDVLARVATGATAQRQIDLLAVTENGTVSRYAGGAWSSVAATVLPGSYVWTATLFGKTFVGNGKDYRAYDHQNGTLRSFEESTNGRIPPRCRLGAAWRGRMVLARGDSAHEWFMSATADPFDWDFEPDVVTETQAVSAASSQVGAVPDLVNALMPWSDDLLLFGCDSSIWRLTGDPMTSGELHRVSDITGVAFGQAWCKDPEQRVYFWGSRGGLYSLTPDGGVQALSEGRIHRRLQEIDLGRYSVRLLWNDRDLGVHCFLLPFDGKGEPYHYFFERKTGAFWADQFHGASRQVRGVYLADGDGPADRVLLLGGADGRIRKWDSGAHDDDGEAIRATCLVGPIAPDTFGAEMRLVALEVVLARDQGGCMVGTLGTREADAPYMVSATTQLNPGRNGRTLLRARGANLWVQFDSSEIGQSFAVEDLAAHVAVAGRKR